jgi:DNA-directed RNA polymerase specialized sigma24 family protein
MHSVDADRMLAAAAAGNDEAWGGIVDANVERLWLNMVAKGLSEADAAQICELAWLRLGQRLHTFNSLADVVSWLDDTAGREAAALLSQRSYQAERAGVPDNVVRLTPGIPAQGAPGIPAQGASPPLERGAARPATVRRLVTRRRPATDPASARSV